MKIFHLASATVFVFLIQLTSAKPKSKISLSALCHSFYQQPKPEASPTQATIWQQESRKPGDSSSNLPNSWQNVELSGLMVTLVLKT